MINYNRIEKILSAAKNSVKTNEGKYRIEEIEIYPGYSEPGYDGETVALGNWNGISKYENNKYIALDDTPERVCKLLEKLGVSCEWSDEWTSCGDCGKLVRTTGNSYSWQPSFVIIDDCELVCHECMDNESYLESLEGNCEKACTIADIDPCDYGYVKLEEYESGWYGINDSPTKIGKSLEEKGISRFIFYIEGNEQFRTRFSVYVHESENLGGNHV